MKGLKRIASFLMAVIMWLSLLAGCSTVKKTDAYMTKGEFMLLFAYEAGINPSADTDVKLSIKEDDKHFDAAVALVEIGYLTEEEASTDLDMAVTKEFVAEMCVEHLYFRKTADITLKDEGKLLDPQACKDAVGHGIVEAKNGYFDAKSKMTYVDCKKAIDTMMSVDANSSFTGAPEIEVVLKDNVKDITEYFTDETLFVIDPSDPMFEEIVSGMTVNETAPVSSNGNLEFMSLSARMSDVATSNGEYTVVPLENGEYSSYEDVETDERIIIRVPANSIEGKRFKCGDFISYGLWMSDPVNMEVIGKRNYTFCGEIVGINDSLMSFNNLQYIYYTVRIAGEQEVLESAKLNNYNSNEAKSNWKNDKYEDEIKKKGFTINNFTISGGDINLSVSGKIDNKYDGQSWIEPVHTIDYTYTFSVKDISADIEGFGGLAIGKVDNAIFKLNYTVESTFVANTDAHLVPANNGNGKFPSNLLRSRFTDQDAPGAEEIKIARLYADIGYGFKLQVYVYLTVKLDGSVELSLRTDYGNGFQITKNGDKIKVTPIKDVETTRDFKANINGEAAVNCRLGLSWLTKKSWVDATVGVGLGLSAESAIFTTQENGEMSREPGISYYPADVLNELKKCCEMEYCIDCRIYIFVDIEALSGDCIAGKLVRSFNKDFSLKIRAFENDLFNLHWENGAETEKCTRGEVEDSEEIPVVQPENETFGLTEYKIIVPEDQSGMLKITSYPVSANAIDNMGGIAVRVKDPSIATAHISGGHIVVNSVGVGSTELVVETRNKRFIQECSVTVTEVAATE